MSIRPLLFSLKIAVLMLTALSPAWATMTVRYTLPEALDERPNHPLKLLALALSKSGADCELRPGLRYMPQNRALTELAKGVDIDVVWTMTSNSREKEFLPIRIPIDKGLLGWRIFLINKNSAADFASIRTLNDLKKYEAVQGHDWPDFDILRANGLKVQPNPGYEGMFRMLQIGRVAYFPRSILEIWDEEKNHPDMNLEIEKTLILQYPTALYFFVNKENHVLANVIETGLRAAIKDGSFEKLFQDEYGEYIKRANLTGRTRFRLANPLLSKQAPPQELLWSNEK